MSNAKHTLGPWKFLKRGMIVTQDETKIVGTFHKASDNECDDELLIAAAPELLNALEAISLWTESAKCKQEIGGLTHSKLLASCKSAITKARGE